MTAQPIKLSIAALGGQGGGVLSNWLIDIAEAEGYLVQATSVPGVAQRTGATIYYLEFFPRAEAERAGREPIMALMPVAGDVDCVIASELVEAGRVIQRGLVTQERTVLIASSHREYTISERSAMGDGTVDAAQFVELARDRAKRLILFDMEKTAERHQSVISSVLLGAVAGSAALPFRRKCFEDAIRHSGIAVRTNLAAFADAYEQADQSVIVSAQGNESRARLQTKIPRSARSRELQGLLDRLRRLPETLQPVILEGVRRTIDYQDPAYAALYLDRIDRNLSLEERCTRPAGTWTLTDATARSLALWMTFEDTIRVADLKTRGSRFVRVRNEVRAAPDQIVGITEFMKPRVQELTGTLPTSIGLRLRRSARASRWLSRLCTDRKVRATTLAGFLTLRMVAGLRRHRRSTLRFREENERIEQWLADICRIAPRNHALAIEIARAQRLVKGYGETHERGWRSFKLLMSKADKLVSRADGATDFARMQAAALADEDGSALVREVEKVDSAVARGEVPSDQQKSRTVLA